MTQNQRHLDSVEDALSEFDAAERAGVFGRTPVSAGDLIHTQIDRAPAGIRRLGLRLVPIAAVLLIALTVWTWMFVGEIADIRRDKAARMAASEPLDAAPISFATCMNGPSAAEIEDACREFDRNGDDMIDLRDFGAFQLAFAAPTPSG